MLESIIWILLAGFFGGQLARKAKLPPLVGMVLIGILIGPQCGDVLGAEILNTADALRTMAVMVILMKAGLGLDRDKLVKQGSVALRLGFLPGLCEAIVVAVVAVWFLDFDWSTGLLLGCILGAESPAVIVPGMLRLKRLGWGVKKGIPDAILTGSALSDVILLLLFSLLLAFISQGEVTDTTILGLTFTPLQLLPFQVILQISLGILLGWVTARMLVILLSKQNWSKNSIQDGIVAAGFALWLVVLAEAVPIFSGYLAVMATGFFLIEFDTPLARRLRDGFNSLWTVAEIILFVLLGASIQLSVMQNTLWFGLLLLLIGTFVGRSLGWYLSTLGSNWNLLEKLFLLPGNLAKATVQAAIGAVPLAAGVEGGETILAISALSILVTAPIGAWAIPTFAPKLLEKGEVDPTKVAISKDVTLLATVDTTSLSVSVLTKAAELARRCDGDVLVMHVIQKANAEGIKQLQISASKLLADIRYQFITVEGNVAEEIINFAKSNAITEIIMGKTSSQVSSGMSTNSVTRDVIEGSPYPVVVVS